jgi:hypothetical protein
VHIRSNRSRATPAASRALRTLTAACVLASVACGDDDSTGLPAGNCTTDVTISVSAGTTPTFTWSPACRVTALLVEVEAGGDVWYIEATGAQGIASGVVYGTEPAGAEEDQPAIPLVAGETYDVLVARGDLANLELAGMATFTP